MWRKFDHVATRILAPALLLPSDASRTHSQSWKSPEKPDSESRIRNWDARFGIQDLGIGLDPKP